MLFGKHFFKYYIKFGLYFLSGIVILVFVDWFQLDIPKLVGSIIDILGQEAPDLPLIYRSIGTIALLALGVAIGRFIWRFTIFGASRKIEHELRKVMFIHATTLPQQYYNKEKVGGLMAYFTNDLEAMRMAYGPGILTLIDGLVLGSFAVYRMANLSGTMTLFAGIPMLLMMFVMIMVFKRIRLRFKLRQKAFEDLSDFTQESYSGITVIKAFVREIKEAMFFQKKSFELYDKHINFIRYIIIINLSISIALNMVILLVIVYGSYLVLNPGATGLTPGQLTEYIAYFFTLVWPVMAIAMFMNIHGQARASGDRIATFLDEEPIVKDGKDVTDVDHLEGQIEIRNLTFQYPDGEEPVLKDVSFEIKKGEMVGVLGRTGSGKSSLVDLLLRTYNLDENQIFIDGHDIMKLPIAQVRSLMGYVPQDNFLFSETITHNIGFAFDEPDPEVVETSAKLADVYENVIEFKDQFETVLGERGVTVSGGQKQRISIARALAKDPDVLILDDSVSAVDTKTEEAIINNLHRVRKGKTTIFIAHRISTVKRMDKIILLERGEVVAIGNHKELLKTSPLYQDMVKRQELENIIQGGELQHEGL